MRDIDIVQYDDLAIVTAKIVISIVKSGRDHENEYRTTNVWIKEEGDWKRAGFHDGKIK